MIRLTEIDKKPPGPSLDRWIATEIMGNKVIEDDVFGFMEMHTNKTGENVYCPLRPYSTSISSTRMVISRMVRMGYQDAAAYWHNDDRPEVICKAALRIVLKKKAREQTLKLKAGLRIVK